MSIKNSSWIFITNFILVASKHRFFTGKIIALDFDCRAFAYIFTSGTVFFNNKLYISELDMTQNTGQIQILVCDDDDIFLKFCTTIIQKMGFSVLGAANGDEAIDLLAANPTIKLALIDLLMPVRSGWEVIKYIKKQEQLKNMPLIAITGLTPEPEDLLRVKESCRAVIHKGADFDVEELSRIIKELTSNIG